MVRPLAAKRKYGEKNTGFIKAILKIVLIIGFLSCSSVVYAADFVQNYGDCDTDYHTVSSGTYSFTVNGIFAHKYTKWWVYDGSWSHEETDESWWGNGYYDPVFSHYFGSGTIYVDADVYDGDWNFECTYRWVITVSTPQSSTTTYRSSSSSTTTYRSSSTTTYQASSSTTTYQSSSTTTYKDYPVGDFECGNAIYHDNVFWSELVGVNEWHAALYYKYIGGDPTDGKNHLVIHQVNPPNYDDTFTTFLNSQDFLGNYEPGNFETGYINKDKRNDILQTAKNIVDEGGIGYPFLASNAIEFDGIGTNVDNITEIRCDGFVEYCYESNGVMVWGRPKDWDDYTNYDIRYNVDDHNDVYWPINIDPEEELSPKHQAIGENTTFTHATSTNPTIAITYPSSPDPSSPTIVTSINFNIYAAGEDDESGVKTDSYHFEYAVWLGSSWSSWYILTPDPSTSPINFTGSDETLYAFTAYVYDKAGNQSDWAIPKYIYVSTPKSSTTTYRSSSTTTYRSSSTTTYRSSSTTTTAPVSSTTTYQSSSTTTGGSTTTINYSSSSTTTVQPVSSTTTFQSTSTIPGTTALSFSGSRVDDDSSENSSGNNNGIIDPGETIELYVTLKNTGSADATGVSAELSTSDPYVGAFLFNTSSSYPDIPAGGTGENTDDFDFPIDPNCPAGHIITFDLAITSNEGSWTDSFKIMVGRSPAIMPWLQLLLLDD